MNIHSARSGGADDISRAPRGPRAGTRRPRLTLLPPAPVLLHDRRLHFKDAPRPSSGEEAQQELARSVSALEIGGHLGEDAAVTVLATAPTDSGPSRRSDREAFTDSTFARDADEPVAAPAVPANPRCPVVLACDNLIVLR